MLGAMDNKRTELERAFDLAKSGACASIDDLRRCLKLEGYSLHQVTGPSLNKQLRALILEAQRPATPKGPKGRKRPPLVGSAVKVTRIATGEDDEIVADDGKDKAAQSLGRRGGRARAEQTSAKQRSAIAKKAAAVRWAK